MAAGEVVVMAGCAAYTRTYIVQLTCEWGIPVRFHSRFPKVVFLNTTDVALDKALSALRCARSYVPRQA